MSETSIVVASEWQAMREQATVFVKSGLLPKAVDTAEKAIVIMMQARELGIGPMQAFAGINVIQGKASVSPQLMLALIERSGQMEDMQIVDDGNTCTVTMKRVGKAPHSEAFSMEDARRMMTTENIKGEKKQIALADKYNWRQMPVIMRKWRAVSACARVVFADVVMGMYTTEELNPDVTVDVETGEIRDVTPTVTEMVDSGLVTVDDIERIEAGGPVNEPHWTETQNWKTFWTYTKNNLKLTDGEVHEALEVEHVKDFTGSKDEAFTLLKNYAVAKQEAVQEDAEQDILEEEEIDNQATFDAILNAPKSEAYQGMVSGD